MSSKQQQSKRDTCTSVDDTTSDDATNKNKNKNKKARIAIKDNKNEIITDCNKRSECNNNNNMNRNNNNNNSKIWLNNKLVDRPNYPTSYGILLYRGKKIEEEEVIVENNNNNNNSATCSSSSSSSSSNTQRSSSGKEFEYLFGLIPQGNSWTVFKGLPEGNNERPEETAIREFEEESSLTFPYNNNKRGDEDEDEDEDEEDYDYNWDKKYEILYGVTSTKKLLQIYLIPAPLDIDISKFNISNVVKIDKGYMVGKPEIIQINFLTKNQAIEGTTVPYGKNSKVAKIYKSQISILERAETILNTQNMK
jgi:8-oxo-dGTP pyrophosphatase MutT (NUDIX family)